MDDLRRDVTRTLEDAAYVAVGLAVLEFQKAQVRRRALLQQIGRLGDLIGGRAGGDPAASEDPTSSGGTAPSKPGEAGESSSAPGRSAAGEA